MTGSKLLENHLVARKDSKPFSKFLHVFLTLNPNRVAK